MKTTKNPNNNISELLALRKFVRSEQRRVDKAWQEACRAQADEQRQILDEEEYIDDLEVYFQGRECDAKAVLAKIEQDLKEAERQKAHEVVELEELGIPENSPTYRHMIGRYGERIVALTRLIQVLKRQK